MVCGNSKPKTVVVYVDRKPGGQWQGPWRLPLPSQPGPEARVTFDRLHRLSFERWQYRVLFVKQSDEPVPSVA